MIARRSRNKRKGTPIPGLAEHIAGFTDGRIRHRPTSNHLKHELAAIRAAFADRVYAASSPIRKEAAQ